MLTREYALVAFRGGRAFPDRLTRRAHGHYLRYAEKALRVYRNGVGRTRRDLHRGVERAFAAEPDCPLRRIRAFCKLLDDRCEYDEDRRGAAAELRKAVFRAAATRHPLVRQPDRLFESGEAAAKAEIAAMLGRRWQEIDRDLFADVIEFQPLVSFDDLSGPAALLSRYNVAQAQVALFNAEKMTVWAGQDFKTILRHAKLARLMHTISRDGETRYVFRFDGPASVLRETRRYGAAMARFLPALLACQDWRMSANLRTQGGYRARFDLSPDDGLTGHMPAPNEFDSSVEAAFARKWGDEPRDRWRLIREGAVLHRGQKVFVPDFTFRHEDGREVLLEIIGYWTPEYLAAKAETLKQFADRRILLAVSYSDRKELPALPSDTIHFKTALQLKDVLSRLAERSEPRAAAPPAAGPSS